ncbi:MAG: 50S ribosomal protein L15 [Candidatus Neomarinimicrobiota bacterium]
MKLGSLKPAAGSTHSKKRLGRGPGSGAGRTAGRGEKGYHSRSGSKHRPWFEGGQMPLHRRVPKRGFSNHLFKKTFQIVNLTDIERLDLVEVDANIFKEKGLVRYAFRPIKVLGDGELTKAVNITAAAFSRTAVEKINKSGGSAVVR